MNKVTTWDKEVTGLHTISTLKKSSYYLYYRTKEGRQRRNKIGDVGIISLSEVRGLARKILAQVTLGQDPFGEEKLLRNQRTVGEAFKEAMLFHWGKPRYEKSGWKKEVEYLWEKHLSKPFKNQGLTKVSAPQIHNWHEKLSETPYAANRAKAVLSTIFKYAEKKGYMPPGTNPCQSVPNFTETQRKRFASLEEIQKIGAALQKYREEYPREVAFIYLLIFTGSRPSAIERALWTNLKRVDLNGEEYGILQIEGKSGAEEVVLPPQAMRILETLPKEGTLTGINLPRKFWEKVRAEVGCEDLWARDWRRTFGTFGLSNGVPIGMLSELLNHKDQKTSMLYAKLTIDSRARACYAIGTELEKALVVDEKTI